MIGCAKIAPFPDGVRGFLVDDKLEVFRLPEGDQKSIRPFVERVLARNSLPKCVRYFIAPDGIHVACLGEGKKLYIVNLATAQCLQTLNLPPDCARVGALSWKPDSGGFTCYIRTQWNPNLSDTGGAGDILFAEAPEFHWRKLVDHVTDLSGESSLSRQAWSSNECFVFGDREVVKAYDLLNGTIKTLTAGCNPAGFPPQGYLFATEHGYWSVLSLRSIEGGTAKRLQNEGDMRTSIAIIREPVVSPDGHFIVFVNSRAGSFLGVCGIDYNLVVLDTRQNKYVEIRQLVPCRGFYWFDLDFTDPADGPIIKLISNAVWVQPVDWNGWRCWLSKQIRQGK
jgi:hypothetical protein